MIKSSFQALLLPLVILATSSIPASGQMMEILDQVDIEAIETMQYYKKDNAFRAKVTVVFSNGAERDVKLDDGEFLVGISSKQTPSVHLGRGTVTGLEIPAGKQKSYQMDLFVGYEDADTVQRMVQIFNIIGDPKQKPIMELKGECKLGARMERGWASSNSVSIEFIFTPKIQDEVLFQ